jgi:hypothetical protein
VVVADAPAARSQNARTLPLDQHGERLTVAGRDEPPK